MDRKSQADRNRVFFDSYYDKPAWWFRFRYDTQVKRKTCLRLLKIGGVKRSAIRVFEYGFGSGDLILSFARDCEIFGAEISSSAVANIRSRARNHQYRKQDFFLLDGNDPIPLPDGSVDLAIASHVLEHVTDDRACIMEIRRLLKPGGHFAALVPVNEIYDDPFHLRRYTFDSLRNRCIDLGFRLAAGFENERLFHFVEDMYVHHRQMPWTIWHNIARVLFNVLTAPLPISLYRVADSLVSRSMGIPPRQAALLFQKS